MSVESLLPLSLRSLQDQHPLIHERFAWFGVLPENVSLTPPMMATVWQMEVNDAQDLLELFWKQDLLLAAGSITLGEQIYPCYLLHDQFHGTAHRLLSVAGEPGLGLSPTEAHRTLLARYYDRLPLPQEGERNWSQLTEDGYIHDHLTWHMEQAEQFEAMLLLLNAETAGGKNAWFEAQDRLGKLARYRDDVKRSWRAVQRRSQEAAEQGEPITTLGLELRHCLILPSLPLPQSEDRFQVREQELPTARKTEASALWAEALPGIATALAASGDTEQAVSLAGTIRNAEHRAEALTGIVTALAASGDTAQALSIARTIEKEEYLLQVLTGIVGALHVAELSEALSIVRMMGGSRYRAQALITIAPHLDEARLSEALSIAQAIGDADSRALALTKLAGLLTAEQLSEGLAIVRTTEEILPRAKALRKLVSHLTIVQLSDALSIGAVSYRAQALAGIAKALAAIGDTEQALSIARMMKDAASQTAALTGITGHLTAAEIREVLAVAHTIESAYDRVLALAGIAGHLPPGEKRSRTLAQALEIVSTEWDPSFRAKTFAEIADRLPPSEERSEILAEALSLARTIDSDARRMEALLRLAAQMPPSAEREQVFAEALAIARTIKDYQALPQPAQSIGEVAKALTVVGEIEQALSVAWLMEDPASRDSALPREWTWEDIYVRKETLCQIAAAFNNLPFENFYPLFSSLMQLCALQEREVISKVIGQMSLALLEKGTRQTIDELLRALQDVERWWPKEKERMVVVRSQ